jgi:hypothetical protein
MIVSIQTVCLSQDIPTAPLLLDSSRINTSSTSSQHRSLESKQLVGIWNRGTGATALSLNVYKYLSLFDSEIDMLLYSTITCFHLVSHLTYTLSIPFHKRQDTPQIDLTTFFLIKKDVMLQFGSLSSHPS